MIDLQKLQNVFVEESREQLVMLEAALLRLEDNPDDGDPVGDIFRATHTIKGSSGIVGLEEICSFTNVMEEAFELVRSRRLKPDKELVSLFLRAFDLLRDMVEAAGGGGPFDRSRTMEVEDELRAVVAARPTETTYRVQIAPSPGRPTTAPFTDPLVILEALAQAGELLLIKMHCPGLPPLEELDPQKLYCSWDVQLRSPLDRKGLESAIAPLEGAGMVRFTSDAPEPKTKLGEVLVGEGLLSESDLREALKEQKRLGDILLKQGKVTQDDISVALERQKDIKSDTFRRSLSSTIRVDLNKLDHLINNVGEMVIMHSMLQTVLRELYLVDRGAAQHLETVLGQLHRIGRGIQESAMSLRMLPVGDMFRRYSRLVRELALSSHKDIDLFIEGEETELDKGVLEKITDPLVHLIRNAIDHGIELPHERVAAGKHPRGAIVLRAYQQGDSVYLDVADDGRGLDGDKIAAKAVTRGLIDPRGQLTVEQVHDLIFLPGFSTAEAGSAISGRGVGMDVVKRNIDALNGTVSIATRRGEGTTFSIKIPLTLAILDSLIVSVGAHQFVIPIASVVESRRPQGGELKTVHQIGECIDVRGEYLPLIRLHEELGCLPREPDPRRAVVVLVATEGRRAALLVDELLGEQQVVIKTLGSTPRVKGIAGGTILGDGRVALVIDVPGIVHHRAATMH